MRYDPGIRESKEKPRRRVFSTPAFRESKAQLEKTPEMVEAFERLMLRVKTQPEQGVPVPGFNAFVMKNHGWGYPMLRVYYFMNEKVIRLLHVEVFDPIGAGV